MRLAQSLVPHRLLLSSRCFHGSRQNRFLWPWQNKKAETEQAEETQPSEQIYSEQRLLGYSRRQMYQVVSEVEHYHRFVPWCKQSNVICRKRHKLRAELVIGFPPFLGESYTSHVTLLEPHLVASVSTDTNLFHHLKAVWKFAEIPPQSRLSGISENSAASQSSADLSSARILQESPLISEALHQGPHGIPLQSRLAGIPENSATSPSSADLSSARIPSESQLISKGPHGILPESTAPGIIPANSSRNSCCRLDFAVSFQFASPVHSQVSRLFFDQVIKENVNAFMREAERRFGPETIRRQPANAFAKR